MPTEQWEVSASKDQLFLCLYVTTAHNHKGVVEVLEGEWGEVHIEGKLEKKREMPVSPG